MILVTGAGGFLGSRVLSLLRSKGQEVASMRRGEVPAVEGHEWTCDLLRPDHVEFLANKGGLIDCLVHLAGHIEIALEPGADGAIVPGREDLWALYAGNVTATASAVKLALRLGAEHVVFASSQAVYGQPDTETVAEDSPCRPLEHYAASKVAAEELLRLESLAGLNVSVLRFPGLYGGDRAGGAVQSFCRSAVRDKVVRVHVDIPVPYNVLHVDDVASGIAACVDNPPVGWRCLNLSDGMPCSLEILAQEVASLVNGCTVELGGVPQKSLRMDSSRAVREIGWNPMPRKLRLKALIDSEAARSLEEA